jgi:formylglycine-generating enzyme
VETGPLRPRNAGAKAAVLLVVGPLLLTAGIIGGRAALPVKELQLAPLVPFDLGSASAPPPALLDAPMIAVAPGSFEMGSTAKNESPPHRVAVAAFSIDATEVTVDAYRACVEATRCPADGLTEVAACNWATPGRGPHPMNCVDWNEADIYCRWLGKRLPTEEEWEFAARGPEGRIFPWGNSQPDEPTACFNRATTCPAGERAAGRTPQGALDLAGNVWEWTASPYCAYAVGDCGSVERVVRGGSYTAREGAKLRSSARSGHVITLRETYLGFRCARGG